jgi:hypothetical protein
VRGALAHAPIQPPAATSASPAAQRCERAWAALAAFRAGRAGSAGVFASVVAEQQPDGSLLGIDPATGPELQAYYELVLLHALASFALVSHDAPALSAVCRAAEFHTLEIQPDHATAQPWALHAFIYHEPARPLADQMLHALEANFGRELDAVSLLLLRDALYCLRPT